MLHAKFRGNWLNGSGKEDFFSYMGLVAILVM